MGSTFAGEPGRFGPSIAFGRAGDDGDLSPPLSPEAEMAVTYSVGRTSVREALRILEVQGLVSIRIGRELGPMVVDPHHCRRGPNAQSPYEYSRLHLW